MNKSVLMIMGGALLIAALVGYVVQSKMPSAPVASTSTIEVLVANKAILVGTKLKPEDIRWQSWPDDANFKGLIKKSDQPDLKKLTAIGSPLRRSIESGEPVTTASLVMDAKETYLSAFIAPNMRAISIPISSTTAAAGFITPGDYVDIILTYTPKMPAPAQQFLNKITQRYANEVILRKVKVLAIDQNSKTDKHDPKLGKTATIEVSLEDAQKITMAEKMGTLTLYLRRLGEEETVSNPPPSIRTDMQTSELMKLVRVMVQEASREEQTGAVRMYSGNTVQNLPVRNLRQ